MDCQSEPVKQESINHAMDQDRKPSKTEFTSSSNGLTNRGEEVGTETAELAEKAVGSGEASVDERDSECRAEGEEERGEEGEGMELEESREDRTAPRMETDAQRGVEGAGEAVSAGKAQVYWTKITCFQAQLRLYT